MPHEHGPRRLAFDPSAAKIVPRAYQVELARALVDAATQRAPGSKFAIEVATGGGKTRIVNDFVAEVAVRGKKRVLVVTKDWQLLGQMAADLCARHEGALARVGHVGGGESAARLFDGARQGAGASVFYTTIHTWHARRDRDFARRTFDVVVIDEVHWGEHGKLYKALHRKYAASAVFVGATATPRHGSEFERVGEPQRFMDLVRQGVLAQPVFTSVPTGVPWSPRRSAPHGDFVPSALQSLGLERGRNATIVDTHAGDPGKWGKTLVFACSIEHCDLLASALSERGVRAVRVHSKMPADEKHAAIDSFKAGRADVLVNMAMLTHGVDIPDIRSVFLCRPTASALLFQQMVGRGARRIPGKAKFNVVDFVDAMERHAVDVVRPEGFFGARPSSGAPRRCPALTAHAFVPATLEVLDGTPGYEALAGLEIQPLQTFGIEFEATWRRGASGAFAAAADKVLVALRGIVPAAATPLAEAHADGKDNTVWNVEPDASCGFELTSRILKGREGFEEVVDVLRALEPVFDDLGLTAADRCVGTHVHLGWALDLNSVTDLLAIGAYYEPAIMSLVAPSRAESRYLRSARRLLRRLLLEDDVENRLAILASHRWRHTGINPSHLASGYRTVEVRYHSGTLDAAKILQWVSLWMRILSAAERGGSPGDPLKRAPQRPLSRGPRGDVAALCSFLCAGPALTERLVARRNHVVAQSWVPNRKFGERARPLLATWRAAGSAERPRS